ncbi:hypothetical protein [Phaeobacter sp. HF9A]|uniref:VpaChn25_0724 family phage protein n=1 Tax=Phaeobacter sp. HF9A TaxID=2721561 RepID=UPI001430BB89|nr:hypothetical protein [Phaeobacter sp. HF9A]NIZ13922.1 hypothetical protein [Phaeobacter sp. HF9A]
MSYADDLRKDARLSILRFLEGAPCYTSNVFILSGQLPRVGIAYTRDQVTTEIHWLEEQGMLTTENHAGFIVAVATMRGVEIAQGIARHPDIQRPRPGA